MKLIDYETNRAIRFGDIIAAPSAPLRGSNLVRALVERYGFMESPKNANEFNLQAGIVFIHGYFKSTVIERFQIYNNGLLVEVRSDTNDADEFLDDVTSWAVAKAGLAFSSGPLGAIYTSQIIVQSDAIALDSALKAINAVSSRVAGMIAQHSPNRQLPAQVAGFSIQTDPGENGGWNFRFERRAGRPFAEDVYFSSAPLRTSDHMVLLEEIEGLLAG